MVNRTGHIFMQPHADSRNQLSLDFVVKVSADVTTIRVPLLPSSLSGSLWSRQICELPVASPSSCSHQRGSSSSTVQLSSQHRAALWSVGS
ncbi:hypothetical protein VZT92_009325 [Zoarces viviparus]|uniref:Uncharacterized protein n=1 Tax=Zoarces viviparus TaxID=48416 RepID=A0AAW1FJE1_ZOAVI